MSASREGPNPLRPYHIPQPVLQESLPTSSSSNVPPPNARPSKTSSPAKHGLGTSARDMLSDLDYSDYLSEASPSALELVKSLLDQGLWKYSSVFMAQPFELAKVILQVQDAGSVTDEEDERDRVRSRRSNLSRSYNVGCQSPPSLPGLNNSSYHPTTQIMTLNPTSHPRPPTSAPLGTLDTATLLHHLHRLQLLAQGGISDHQKPKIKQKSVSLRRP